MYMFRTVCFSFTFFDAPPSELRPRSGHVRRMGPERLPRLMLSAWVAHTRRTVHYVADAPRAPALVQGSWGEPGCPRQSHLLVAAETAAAEIADAATDAAAVGVPEGGPHTWGATGQAAQEAREAAAAEKRRQP